MIAKYCYHFRNRSVAEVCEAHIVKNISRHVGVFCVGLMLAVAIAFAMPLDVDPKNIMYGFVVVFFVYLGLSIYLESKRTKRK